MSIEQVEDIVAATLGGTQENAIHWSCSGTAERSGLSKSTVGLTWKAFSLAPTASTGSSCPLNPS